MPYSASPALRFLLLLKTHGTKSRVSKVWPVDDLGLQMQIPGLLIRATESQMQTPGAQKYVLKEKKRGGFQVILLRSKMYELTACRWR